MNKKPKISCIMSVYNTEKYLDECIQSVLNQTYTDFEFIISDDGSRDKSKEIIKKYAKKDERIVFLNNKVNRGIVPNLIDCINKAKGDYIAIMESDDISYPERFELELKAFNEDEDLFLVGGDGNIIDEKGNRKYDWITSKSFYEIKNRCLFETPFNTPCVMFKKQLCNHFKNIEYPYLWDNDLYLNTIFSDKKCVNISNFIIKKRELNNSLLFRKYFKIATQHLLIRLHIVFKYKLYKEHKFIIIKIIWNEFMNILSHYLLPFIESTGLKSFLSKVYNRYFKI